MRDYDTIVIGSGAGGLAAALPLAQAGQRVLVCEQHDVPGGWCHSFTLDGYRFSPGVHYIGNLGPGGSMRAIYEGLGVSQDMAFCEINPDGFDHIVVGEERFDIPKGKERFMNRLQARFPHEKEGIAGYFEAIDNIMTGLKQLGRVNNPIDAAKAPWQSRHILRWAVKDAQALLAHHVSDPLLQAFLSGQAGDHGMPPSLVSAPVHVAVTQHYFNGAYFPLGGGFSIPRAFVRALKRSGGELRLQTSVEKILLRDGHAVGVRLKDGTEISASNIISNADPEVTYGRLLGREHLSRRLLRKLNRVHYSTSALSLFLAVDMDLRAAGMDSGNFWLYGHSDLNKIYSDGLTAKVTEGGKPDAIFLTATTLKDPSKKHSGHHTLEAFTFVNYEPFRKWAAEECGHRADDYKMLKEKLAAQMLAVIDDHIPGFSKHVVFCEMGTPLSNEYYVAATQGNLYGIDKRRFQVGPGAFPLRTEFPGLWMCGASTTAHGVSGATTTGLSVAEKILACRQADLLTHNGPELPIYPSEDINQWPADLQRKIARRDSVLSEPERLQERERIRTGAGG